MEGVEPPSRLSDVLDDEVGGEVALEPVGPFEWVVDLSEWHSSRLEPAVVHVGHPRHGGSARRVIGIGPGQLIDRRSVQVGRAYTEVLLKLGDASVDIHPRMGRIVAAPDWNRRSPEAIPADRPIPG